MAVDAFLKLGDITGESSDDKHSKEIDILAWSWGMSQSGTTHQGSGGGAGKVSVQDLSFTHYIDRSSPTMILHCCQGTHIPKATLTVRKAGKDPLEYLIIRMEDVLITSISTGGSGGEERLTENVTLNFARFEYDYKPQKADGSGDAAVQAKYNIATNK